MTVRRLALCTALGASLVGLLLAPSLAGAHIYWTNLSTGAIGRANQDGSGIEQNFVTGGAYPYGVAVDDSHVYWSNEKSPGSIGRANLDGTGVDQGFIGSGLEPSGVAVDDGHVYWADYEAANLPASALGRASLDGSGLDLNFITEGAPITVAVDATHVYWCDITTNTIGRANLDGTGVDSSFITGAFVPDGIVVDSEHIYWANGGKGGSIGRANLDGTGVDQDFIKDGGAPVGVAVDGSHIYWTNFYRKSIERANLDGTAIEPEFILTAAIPYGVAADPAPPTSGPPVPPGPAPPGPPGPGKSQVSNRFKFSAPKLNRASGAATVTVTVPDPGELVLAGKGIKRQAKRAGHAGKVTLVVMPNGKTVARLKVQQQVKIKATLTFAPIGGEPKSQALKVTLRKSS